MTKIVLRFETSHKINLIRVLRTAGRNPYDAVGCNTGMTLVQAKNAVYDGLCLEADQVGPALQRIMLAMVGETEETKSALSSMRITSEPYTPPPPPPPEPVHWRFDGIPF